MPASTVGCGHATRAGGNTRWEPVKMIPANLDSGYGLELPDKDAIFGSSKLEP